MHLDVMKLNLRTSDSNKYIDIAVSIVGLHVVRDIPGIN